MRLRTLMEIAVEADHVLGSEVKDKASEKYIFLLYSSTPLCPSSISVI